MLNEQQTERYADVLLWGLKTARTQKYRKNDIIYIQYDIPALRLAETLYSKVLDMGMNPIQRMIGTHRMEKSFYMKSNDKQLTFWSPGEKELCENIHGRIFLRAPESLTHLQDIDPKKINTFLVSRKPLREIMDSRENKGLYSWTLCLYPTEELAKHANTTARNYADQVVRACYLDKDDPIAEWDSIYKNVSAIKKWLSGLKVKYLHIESKSFDLRLTPGEHRRWLGISGHNIPSFEIFLSPDWRGTEGTYFANLPSYRTGNLVEDVHLTFQKGTTTNVTAKKNASFVLAQTLMDKGASRVGEFSLTDKRFSRINRFMADTLYDENYGGEFGNCHLALGSSYAGTYSGKTADLTQAMKEKLGLNDSALHWDLVNTEDKTVTAYLTNGKRRVIYEKGSFTY